MKNKKGYIAFDLDGTLFETEPLAVAAVQKAIKILSDEGYYSREIPKPEECTGVLGLINEEIWATLLPGADKKTRKRAEVLVEEIEVTYLKEGLGNLYPGVTETLKVLKNEGWDFLVVSNGSEKYVKAVIKERGLNPLFAGIYSAGEYQTKSKGELLAQAGQKFPQIKGMVGDRESDVQAGKENNVFTVGCRYGYGNEEEIKEADRLINDFKEITDLF